MDITNAVFQPVKMRWDTFKFPIAAGQPVNKFGLATAGSDAIGIVPQTIKVKPLIDTIMVMVSGDAINPDVNINLNALKAMDSIRVFEGNDKISPNSNTIPQYTLPAAKTNAIGGVKKASNVAAVTPVGDTPTDVESTINSLLSALKTAGIMVADS